MIGEILDGFGGSQVLHGLRKIWSSFSSYRWKLLEIYTAPVLR